jgi:predicted GIY-YIG superfamily endonuclease
LPWVYVLRCADRSLYVGHTTDLEGRIDRHRAGLASRFTASRLPITLAYSEVHATIESALERKRQLKRWTRAKKEALIAGDFALLKRL